MAVRVNVMDLLIDNADNEYPNGLHIKNLNRIETYSLDFGVSVAPLVAPGYTTYGIYEMPMPDKNFIKNYGNFRDFYYDFIIGSDGL